jgi:hypothetical protein
MIQAGQQGVYIGVITRSGGFVISTHRGVGVNDALFIMPDSVPLIQVAKKIL